MVAAVAVVVVVVVAVMMVSFLLDKTIATCVERCIHINPKKFVLILVQLGIKPLLYNCQLIL